MSAAEQLAAWCHRVSPGDEDLSLAQRALLDTVAVTVAARDHRINGISTPLDEAGRWAAAGHILDFDDLHMPSTTHISTVVVPVVLALGGYARDYLVGAGVMARVGMALGWAHYEAGWHATTTSGAIAAAAAAASVLGLDEQSTATALALAVPASGGVQRAFGTDAKSLQVGMAADAGVRAARLAQAGATADPTAIDVWLHLLTGATPTIGDPDATAAIVPDGLAIKIYPCCYALQRPIAAVSSVAAEVDPSAVTRIVMRTPACTVHPLIHHRPITGLQAKFSLEHAAAVALLDDHQGFAAFEDASVARPEAKRLVDLVETIGDGEGDDLLAGQLDVEIQQVGHDTIRTALSLPPGAPARPPSEAELSRKVTDCLIGSGVDQVDITWSESPALLRRLLTH